jgi:hypothetical protein
MQSGVGSLDTSKMADGIENPSLVVERDEFANRSRRTAEKLPSLT